MFRPYGAGAGAGATGVDTFCRNRRRQDILLGAGVEAGIVPRSRGWTRTKKIVRLRIPVRGDRTCELRLRKRYRDVGGVELQR